MYQYEALSIEHRQSAVGRDLEESIPRLNHGIHLIVWKAILDGEILAEIAARRLTRVKRKSVPRQSRQKQEDTDGGFPQPRIRSHTSAGRQFGDRSSSTVYRRGWAVPEGW